MFRLILSLLVWLPISAVAQDRPVLPCDDVQSNTAADALEVAIALAESAVEALEEPDFAESRQIIRWFAPPSADELGEIQEVYENSITWAESVAFLCIAGSDHEGPIYARVLPTGNFVVELGLLFFEADESGVNSRGGTLIHELSHFVLVGATNQEDGEVYGWEEAQELAATDPEVAQRNAENYQFFAESIFWPELTQR